MLLFFVIGTLGQLCISFVRPRSGLERLIDAKQRWTPM
jgi:hypothetical protein